MRRGSTIAIHEFKTMYRRRMFQIVTFGVPLIGLALVVGAWFVQNVFDGDEGESKTKAGYVDGTGLFVGHRLQGRLVLTGYQDQSEGMTALLADRIERLYIIPDHYVDSGLIQLIEVGLGLNLDPSDDGDFRSFLVDNLLNEAGTDSALVTRLKNPIQLARIAVDPEGRVQDLDEPRIVFFQVLVFLLFGSLAMTGGFLLQGLAEEKENRIMEVLLSSVTAAQFMFGKVVGIGLAGLSQILIWVTSARLLLELVPTVVPDVDISPPGIAATVVAVAFFVLGYLLFATLMSGVGAIAPTARESQQLSVIVVMPLIIPIYATVYIVENPTAAIVKFLTFFPLTAPLVVLERLGPEAIAPWEVLTSIVVLGLSTWGAMFLMARIFRAFLLSYGKRPGIREMWWALVRA